MPIPKRGHKRPLSKAEGTGLLAFAAALLLGAIDLRLATIPLTLFVMLCVLAPFAPRAGFFFPVVSQGNTGKAIVALTFDDGPDPVTTPLLLDLLARHRIPATFFVTGRRAERYPHLIRRILLEGHLVGNHAFNHNHYGMFWQPRRFGHETSSTQAVLARQGIRPAVFRPPVGITTPAMQVALAENGLAVVNFSCRAVDRGNRRIRRLADRILGRVAADDIVLLHDADPGDSDRVAEWLREVEKILTGLSNMGLGVVPLDQLIGRPVMHRRST